jgi:hypothetical protein
MRHSNGKRSRGRSGRRPAPQQNINRAYDSNGPAGKLRGTAAQLVEKYVSLARDARVGRDRVLVENFLQHAEHYQRIMNEIMIAQGIEPEAIDDDEQGGYDEQLDGNVNQNYDAGNGGQTNGNGGNGSGGNGNGGYNGGGQRQNNGGQQGSSQPRRDNGGQSAAPPPQPVIAGAEDQPDISHDIPVEVPPVSLTPPSLPSAPRAPRGRRRRPAAAREDGQPAEAAAPAEEPAGEE